VAELVVDEAAEVRFAEHTAGQGVAARQRERLGEEVVVGAGRETADDGEPVHLLGQQRQHFAEADAGHVGRDGAEFAAHLGRSLGLGIEGFVVRDAAGQPEEEHLVGGGGATRRRRGRSSMAEQVQRGGGQRHAPDAQQLTAVDRHEKPPARMSRRLSLGSRRGNENARCGNQLTVWQTVSKVIAITQGRCFEGAMGTQAKLGK
jgi:hypothetical protein